MSLSSLLQSTTCKLLAEALELRQDAGRDEGAHKAAQQLADHLAWVCLAAAPETSGQLKLGISC